jgi:hypothetical protein
VNLLNNLLDSLTEGGELRVRGIDEWSEFKSSKFLVEWNKVFGKLETKISRISGFLRAEKGQ